MAEWEFPNALAEAVRRIAKRRGQHANRVVSPEDVDWLGHEVVVEGDPCDSYPIIARHYRPLDGPLCPGCGRIVQVGRG